MNVNKNISTPNSTLVWNRLQQECNLQLFSGNKKSRNAYLFAVSGLYPGRESNPHGRNGHRILSPDHFPEIPVKSHLQHLHFDAKYDISALIFRTRSALIILQNLFLKNTCEISGVSNYFQNPSVQTLKNLTLCLIETKLYL